MFCAMNSVCVDLIKPHGPGSVWVQTSAGFGAAVDVPWAIAAKASRGQALTSWEESIVSGRANTLHRQGRIRWKLPTGSTVSKAGELVDADLRIKIQRMAGVDAPSCPMDKLPRSTTRLTPPAAVALQPTYKKVSPMLRERGWTVKKTKRHYKASRTVGDRRQVLTFSSTPSDARSTANIMADIRRLG
jgi:hypothetical protein